MEHVGAEGEVQVSAELIVAQNEIREGAVDALTAKSLGQRACRVWYNTQRTSIRNGCAVDSMAAPALRSSHQRFTLSGFIDNLPDNRFLENLKYFSSSMEPNWLGIVPLKEF